MNMYLHELRTLMKSSIIWTCSLVAVAVLYFSVYSGVVKDADAFRNILAAYPPAIRAILGVSLDSLATLLGYYSMLFTFVAVCGAIQAMNSGLSALSRETREKTADFLLVKPVSRASIVSSKILAALTMITATDIVYYIGASLTANLVKTSAYSVKLFFLINLTLFFIQLIFFALGLLISVFFKKLNSVLPISLGVVFGLYILGAVLAADENDAARLISPFRYFSIPYILKNSGYESRYAIAGAVLVAAAVAASYMLYIKKDMPAVS